ncbi:MAG: histidine phosphatase family protein [Pseudomonadota bacterium]
MTTLWWVRHGPTHERAFCGWRDVPADLTDHAALERLSAFLPREAPIISSDLVRARATADAIAGGRTRLPDDRDLREFDFGEWDGVDFSVIDEKWPELSRAYWDQPGDIRAPGGESWNDAEARVARATKRLADIGARDIIVVAHYGAILTQVRRAANVPAQEILKHRIENLSVTCIPPDGPARLISHIV